MKKLLAILLAACAIGATGSGSIARAEEPASPATSAEVKTDAAAPAAVPVAATAAETPAAAPGTRAR